jgi:hypothetical protein
MRRVRTIAVLLGVGAALLLFASPAMSATPRQIYNDYVAHGKLTHHYSQADLDRAYKSALLKGYSHGHMHGFHHVIPPPPQQGLPFTGMDLGLVTFVAIMLLAFGAGLRRFARARA